MALLGVRGPRWWIRRLVVSRSGHVFLCNMVDRRGVCHGHDADGKRHQAAVPRYPTATERKRYELAYARNLTAPIGLVVDAAVRRMQVLADTEVPLCFLPIQVRAWDEPEETD